MTLSPCQNPAADLATLAARINAAHRAGEAATRKALEHFPAAGQWLLEAKKEAVVEGGEIEGQAGIRQLLARALHRLRAGDLAIVAG